jgi:hypothetical protein
MAKILLALVAVLVAFVLTLVLASELGGEVVTLTTRDAGGAERSTHLWVVDYEGFAWLRAGDPGSGWLARLRQDPQVRVDRGGVSARYTAEPAPAQRQTIDRLMAEKYGFADRLIGVFRSIRRAESVPVRLVPAPS